MAANRLSNEATTDKFVIPNPKNALKPFKLKAADDNVNNLLSPLSIDIDNNIDITIAKFHVLQDKKQSYVRFKDFHICHRYGPLLFRQTLRGYLLSMFTVIF